jgi:hypothetical protein
VRARTLIGVFAALSAVALSVSLIRRDNVPAPRWEGYVGEVEDAPDAFHRLQLLDAKLWLGLSIAFACAAFIVLVFSARARRAGAIA